MLALIEPILGADLEAGFSKRPPAHIRYCARHLLARSTARSRTCPHHQFVYLFRDGTSAPISARVRCDAA